MQAYSVLVWYEKNHVVLYISGKVIYPGNFSFVVLIGNITFNVLSQ